MSAYRTKSQRTTGEHEVSSLSFLKSGTTARLLAGGRILAAGRVEWFKGRKNESAFFVDAGRFCAGFSCGKGKTTGPAAIACGGDCRNKAGLRRAGALGHRPEEALGMFGKGRPDLPEKDRFVDGGHDHV